MARRENKQKSPNDEARLAKNARIREAGKATRARRAKMECIVRKIKVDRSHLNNKQKEAIARLFLESKWLTNSCIANERFDIDYLKDLGDKVQVKTPEGMEEREFLVLGGQLSQSVIKGLKDNLRALSKLKSNGRKVGRLRYRRQVRMVNFPQYGNSHKINREKNRVKLAKIPGWMRVRGLDQLPAEAEFANCKLLDKPDGLFIAITCYTDKEPEDFTPGTSIGVDMGVKTHLTFSNGTKVDVLVEESERAKGLRRKISRQKPGSNNRAKTMARLEKVLAKDANKREDIANKIVHELLKNETVYYQDEPLNKWFEKQGRVKAGRRLQGSILGRVKEKLSRNPRAVMLDRYLATTATCICGHKTKHEPDKRTFVCSACGYSDDRDIHAAKNMARLGQSQNASAMEHSSTLADKHVRPVAPMDYTFIGKTGGVWMKQEAPTYSVIGVVHLSARPDVKSMGVALRKAGLI
ncbi:RNA-guided endonuclease InsQ/TnpB family protein [Varibaculum cambriense]|uniref:RNA-guided endonuclease InsQ/TnpB family protein n=1 Tax=Varibaculum cambriense TaxID=184870 RepID=UPI0018D21F87|nr:RNA-guided endonuclease TnpB family protein [Varibaculum cambriense]